MQFAYSIESRIFMEIRIDSIYAACVGTQHIIYFNEMVALKCIKDKTQCCVFPLLHTQFIPSMPIVSMFLSSISKFLMPLTDSPSGFIFVLLSFLETGFNSFTVFDFVFTSSSQLTHSKLFSFNTQQLNCLYQLITRLSSSFYTRNTCMFLLLKHNF